MTKISNNLKVTGTGSTSQALGVTAGNLNISNGVSIGTWALPSDSQVYILSASTSTIPLRIRDYANSYDAFKVNNNGTVEIKNGQTSTSDISLTIGSTSSNNGKGVIQLGNTASGTKFIADTSFTSFSSGNGKWGFVTTGPTIPYYSPIYIDISGPIPVIGSNTNQTRDIRLASGGGKIYFSIGPSSSTGDMMNISSTGNVAIGTMSNATAKLHIYTQGTGSSTIALKVQNRESDAYFQITDDGSSILNGTTHSNKISLSLQGPNNNGQLFLLGNDGTATVSNINYIQGDSSGIRISPASGGSIYLTASSIYINNNANILTSNGRIAYSSTEDNLSYSKIAIGTQSSNNSNYSTHIGTQHIMATYSSGVTTHLTSIGLYFNSSILASTYSGYTQSIIGFRIQPNIRKYFSYNSAITFDVYSGNTQSLAIFDDGNVTIGSTVSSSTKLFVYGTTGSFRLVDGTEGSGKVLTSDDNGLATWVTASSPGISGTAGYIPVFSTSTSILNSNIYQGASGSILIGYTSSSLTYSVNDTNILKVKGNVYFDNNTLTSNKFFLNGTYLFDDINGNISLGYNSLNGNNTANGSYNIAVGYKSLYSNIGNFNIGLGYQALRDNSSGINNIAIGYNSLYTATGSSNIGIGTNALISAYGSNNISLGNTSLYNIKDGYGNISIGIESGLHLGGLSTNDSYNTLVGSYVANGLTQGSYNTIIGGYTQRPIGFTQGSYNTLIGFGHTYSSSSNNNNTIIGSRIVVTSGITNSVIIGDGSGNKRIYIDGTGKVNLNGNTYIDGKISMSKSTNNSIGTFSLVGGSMSISNTSINSNSIIFLTKQTNLIPNASVSISGTSPTGFTVSSSSLLDNDIVAYFIIEGV